MTTTILASFPSPPQGVWHLGSDSDPRVRAVHPRRRHRRVVHRRQALGRARRRARGCLRHRVVGHHLWADRRAALHVLTDWTTYFGPGGAGLLAAFKIQEGGLGIWGAVALGGVGAWIGCRRHGIPLPAFGDAIAPGIVLAQAIGRIGNYFNQELYGRATSLPWGLEIFERRNAQGSLDSLNGVSTGRLIEVVHPTFLYELLWNLVVFALLIWVDRRYRIGHGQAVRAVRRRVLLRSVLGRADAQRHGHAYRGYPDQFVRVGVRIHRRGRLHHGCAQGPRGPVRAPR